MADIKDKIAKLLALSESPNEHEAKAALLKARALMAEHKLLPEECTKAVSKQVKNENIGVFCTTMTNPWITNLSAAIAERYCCRAYRTKFKGAKKVEIGLVGLEDDFYICKRILLYAIDSVNSFIKLEIKRNADDLRGTYRKKCNAYGYGFVQGLQITFQKQEEENQEWGLVMVVPKEVDDRVRIMSEGRKPSSYGKDSGEYRDLKMRGVSDGLNFDPTARIDGAASSLALGGI